MSKRHTITETELLDWLSTEVWHLAAASCGIGSQKKIEVNNDFKWRVTDHNKIAYEGKSMADAVSAYNAAP